ncbi:MAG: phospholipid carrier-dependent glycosyltransferase [Phycisphaerales bacterium]
MNSISPMPERSKTTQRLALFLVPILFIGIFILPLGLRPLIVPDEARYAVIPAEMIDTGEWIVPHLLGVRYFEKPVLGYWMTAVSFLGFGENAFALRLPAALMTGFSAGVLIMFVRRWTRRWDLAAIAAMVFMTSLEVSILGTTAILDAPFTGMVTASIAFFFFGWRATGPPRFGWLVASGLACGCAFLIKGFLAIAIPGIVLAPWLLWQREWRSLFTLPWVPGIAAILVVLPWGLAVHDRAPEFWDYFFWVEHINRYTGGADAQHPEEWWFFIPIFALGLFPWILTLPFVILGIRRLGIQSPEIRLLLCWAIIPIAFFSVSSGKLPTYILPCFAPAAVLITLGLIEFFRTAPGKRTYGEWILIPFGVLILAITPFMPIDPTIGSAWNDGGEWRLLVLGGALIAWGFFDYRSQRTTSATRRVLLGTLGPAICFAVAPACLPTGWMRISKAPMVWLEPFTELTDRSLVLVDGSLMHSARWAWPDAEIRLFSSPGELSWGVKNFDDHADWFIDDSEFPAFLAEATLDRPIVVLSRNPERQKAWFEGVIAEWNIAPPAYRVDRGILLTVWPAGALPAAP